MKGFTVLPVLAAILATVAAAPANANSAANSGKKTCLSQGDAQSILNKYIAFLAHSPNDQAARAAGEVLFADNYLLFGDSINSLEGDAALGTQIQPNKEAYLTAILSVPPIDIGVQTLGLWVVECNKFIWWFNFPSVGSKQYRVEGFNLFTITGDNQIAQNNLEFNSLAWALDTGYHCAAPPS